MVLINKVFIYTQNWESGSRVCGGSSRAALARLGHWAGLL
jgi:hypothetical protein